MSWRSRSSRKDPWHSGAASDPWQPTTASSCDEQPPAHFAPSSPALVFEQLVCRIGKAFRLANADLFKAECEDYEDEIAMVADLLRKLGKRLKPHLHKSKEGESLMELLALLATGGKTSSAPCEKIVEVPQIQVVEIEKFVDKRVAAVQTSEDVIEVPQIQFVEIEKFVDKEEAGVQTAEEVFEVAPQLMEQMDTFGGDTQLLEQTLGGDTQLLEQTLGGDTQLMEQSLQMFAANANQDKEPMLEIVKRSFQSLGVDPGVSCLHFHVGSSCIELVISCKDTRTALGEKGCVIRQLKGIIREALGNHSLNIHVERIARSRPVLTFS